VTNREPFSPPRGEKVPEGRMRGVLDIPSPGLRPPSPRFAGRGALALLLLAALASWLRFGPIDPAVLDQTRFQSATVLDRNGVVLYQPLSSGGVRGEALGSLPENVVRATLAAEDGRFFRHPGVDPIAVARAAWHNVRRGRVVEGGSTLSQQVAKLLLGSRERSVAQKVREMVLALRLEHRFSKREILTMYLNLAPYGNQVHGIARASRYYFGCAPEDLTIAQSAFLAALPQRPSVPQHAAERQRYVLRRMKAPQEAFAERLRFNRDPQPLIAQHYVERVLSSPSSGVIRTTLDARLQRDVAGIVAAHRKRLLAHGATSVAVVVLDNHTDEWRAWEGSGDYFGDTFGGAIDGAATPRQPGSTLKPFTYALAFEQGYSAATVLQDVPSHFPTAEAGVVYTPRNYDGRFRGPLRIREALAVSQNVPAVALLYRLGPATLLRFLRNAGFTDLEHTADYYGLGLTLGDAEVRLDELVMAYAAFARGGVSVDGRRLVSQRTAFLISDILSDPEAREHTFGSGGSLDFPFRVAVKTGTSQAYRDNWTIGYTRDVTVGVWVGNFDRTELRNSSGVTGAAPIFKSVMLAAVKHVRGRLPLGDFHPIVAPADVEALPVCARSGLRPSTFCPVTITEWLPVDGPAEFCGLHRPAVPPRRTLRVTNPPDGATYLIDPTLRSGFQKLQLKATSKATWFVNGKRVTGEWPLKPGKHTIAAVDSTGHRDEVRIYVK
jgi:penicillin-binding protein 1C